MHIHGDSLWNLIVSSWPAHAYNAPMKTTLMHAPLTCSLAARFAAAEGGVSLDIETVNLKTKSLQTGGSLYDINPLGQVSTLRLASGEIITETSTTLLWIQTQSTNAAFRHDPQSPHYFQMVRWIAFCATELHKQIFRVVFYSEATDVVKERIRALAPQRYALLNDQLADRPFLLGDSFSAPDAYLTWYLLRANDAAVEPAGYPHLQDYKDRTLERPLIRDLVALDRQQHMQLTRP